MKGPEEASPESRAASVSARDCGSLECLPQGEQPAPTLGTSAPAISDCARRDGAARSAEAPRESAETSGQGESKTPVR